MKYKQKYFWMFSFSSLFVTYGYTYECSHIFGIFSFGIIMVENKRKTAKIVFGVAFLSALFLFIHSLIMRCYLKKERRVTKQLMGTSSHN